MEKRVSHHSPLPRSRRRHANETGKRFQKPRRGNTWTHHLLPDPTLATTTTIGSLAAVAAKGPHWRVTLSTRPNQTTAWLGTRLRRLLAPNLPTVRRERYENRAKRRAIRLDATERPRRKCVRIVWLWAPPSPYLYILRTAAQNHTHGLWFLGVLGLLVAVLVCKIVSVLFAVLCRSLASFVIKCAIQ